MNFNLMPAPLSAMIVECTPTPTAASGKLRSSVPPHNERLLWAGKRQILSLRHKERIPDIRCDLYGWPLCGTFLPLGL
jgi:hypothetical protein